MIFKRKFYQELMNWKKLDNGSTALLVEGARRVGKTTLVEEFGKNEYEEYLLIDFSIKKYQNEDVFGLVGNHREEMDEFFRQFFVLANLERPLREGKSLIIFDEVQFFPLARQAIKFLVKDGRYHYLETGSLVSIRSNSEGIQIPSEEISLSMYPMDFEEFLENTGSALLLDTIKKAYEDKKPLPDTIHQIANKKLREYLLVGGMPQAVASYFAMNDYSAIDRSKKAILHLYYDDISKQKEKVKIRSIYDDIPSQLSHHSKSYSISKVNKSYRLSSVSKALGYIDEAMIGNRCFQIDDPQYAMSLSKQSNKFRLYLSDVGLYVTKCYETKRFSENELYQRLLLGKISSNDGTIAELYVSQQLIANGYPLYYHVFNVKGSTNSYEIDFLIAKDGKISPIEVKSGDKLSHASLDRFKEKYGKKVGIRYILSFKNLKWGDNTLYLPLYMTFLL